MSEGGASPASGDRAGLVIGAILVLLGLGIGWFTMQGGNAAGYSPVGPKTVPYIIAGAMVVLGLLTGVAAMRNEFPQREAQRLGPMAWVIGGLAVQMLTMKTVGFSIATGLLFAATARGLGRGPLWKTVPFGIVFSFVIWFIFAKGLQLSLPAGPLERLF